MSPKLRRGSAAALAAATVAGLAAAWLVGDYAKSLERRDGARVDVLFSVRPLNRGEALELGAIERSVERRRVPQTFTSAGAYTAADELAGLRPVADLPAGTQLSPALFSPPADAGGYRLRPGERAVSVAAVVSPGGAEPTPGRQVDLYAAGIGGGTGVDAVLAGAEVLAVADGSAGAGAGQSAPAGVDGGPERATRAGTVTLTLRIAESQAAAVIRADAFAADLRAVLRP